MGQFTNGVLVGLGISLLLAPKKGEEMRSLLVERFQAVRGIPPENEELKQQVQDMSARVQATQAMASRTAAMGSAVQNDLNNVANLAGTTTPPTTTPPTTTTSTTSQGATRPTTRPNQPGRSQP